MKKILRYSFAGAIAAGAFLGVNFSNRNVTIAGKMANITLISLGTEAQAYCNELYWPETNTGCCVALMTPSQGVWLLFSVS